MVPTERSVTVATGHGKKAAHHIDAWLRGGIYAPAAKHPVVAFAELNLPIYTDAARSTQKELSVAQRGQGFDEVVSGLSQAEALHEAKRCLSCGNCFECDNCYAACPEDAIVKLGPNEGYAITLDLCTGCGVCVEQCPCHAMEMVAEPTEART
jgi:Pyruvate/2-oxoacid:ferredoxin oxidoreductase delta subunit